MRMSDTRRDTPAKAQNVIRILLNYNAKNMQGLPEVCDSHSSVITDELLWSLACKCNNI